MLYEFRLGTSVNVSISSSKPDFLEQQSLYAYYVPESTKKGQFQVTTLHQQWQQWHVCISHCITIAFCKRSQSDLSSEQTLIMTF